MKNVLKHMHRILPGLREHGCVLMLDFDGVLSPLVRVPSRARISRRTSRILAACAEKMPVAIITGRVLPDIRKRASFPGAMYAGTHGLEWEIAGRRYRTNIPARSRCALAQARRDLREWSQRFPRLIVEDKGHAIALNYRGLTRAKAAAFRRGARRRVEEHVRSGALRVIDALCTFEVVAAPEWTKGECVKRICAAIAAKHAVPLYIGDSLTDEDAFAALRERGITIRVGASRGSAARYYLRSRRSVDGFLSALADLKFAP